MDASAIDAAATVLIALRESTTPIDRLPDEMRPPDLAAGYAVQAAVRQRRGPYAGWKIGCTTAVMQRYLGISHPCAGGIRVEDVHLHHLRLDPSRHRRLGVECEIAVRLGASLTGVVSAATAAAAIASVHPAIEVVEDRYIDWPTLDLPTMVADDFFHRAVVLGPALDAGSLADLPGRLCHTGHPDVTGAGRDILGDPLAALVWLAGHTPLQAGALVLLGSLVKTQWLVPGDEVLAEVGGASVQVSVAAP